MDCGLKTEIMIATKDSFEPARVAQPRKHSGLSDGAPRAVESSPHSSEQLPKSKRVYVKGKLHPGVRVPMREIELTPTKSYTGAIEQNEPVRVYDCAGPWGDPDFKGTVEEGLPALRAKWIRARGDVKECDAKSPKSNSDKSRAGVQSPKSTIGRKPLRAKTGKVVTQLAYARRGIITPEMEFIAIRENMRGAHAPRVSADAPRIGDLSRDLVRNDLHKQHAGSAQLLNWTA